MENIGIEKEIHLQLSRYRQPGLYLDFYDGDLLELTLGNIERISNEYWADPEKIPQNVKDAVEFRRCKHCGFKGKKNFCEALRPVLPLMEIVDKYNSFDPTIAVYKRNEKGLLYVSDTTMQRALTFVSNLSLMSYCQMGRKYRKYFFDIIPIMRTEDIVNRLYLNIYWIHRGETEVADEVISSLNEEVSRATENQLKRLRLISKNDAFINAYILTHLLTDLLHEYKDGNLKERLDQFEV